RGLEYLDRVRPFTELQVFNLSILPGTSFRQTADDLGLEFQPRPPYYVLTTPTLDLEDLYGLMEEAQNVFGILFDDFPPPEIAGGEAIRESGSEIRGEGNNLEPIASCLVDLDAAVTAVLPSPSARALAFTLRLKSTD